jgi:transcriptional regulator GlxA family with amidase domain
MRFICLLLLCALVCSCKTKGSSDTTTPPILSKPVKCESPNWAGKLKVAVVIYNGVEVVDMNGPIDVFTKTNYIRNHYFVYTVAAKDTLVYTENCYTALMPRYTIYNCPSPDIVVLPGCPPAVLDNLLGNAAFDSTVLNWVKALGADKEKVVMAVCTGGILLAKTGLLDGKEATTHYLALAQMKSLFPKVNVIGGVRYADTLNLITTAGITSGIDGALHLVEKYEGKEIADSVAHILVYNRQCPMRGAAN